MASSEDVVREQIAQAEARLQGNIERTEERLHAHVEDQVKTMVLDKVKEMVDDQLRSAGFDQNLTAADLSTRASAANFHMTDGPSYAEAAKRPGDVSNVSGSARTREERREDNFWICRRSLRIWPVEGRDSAGVKQYLLDKLRLDAEIVEDLGSFVVKQVREPRNKKPNEVIVTCLLYTSPSPRDRQKSRMPSSA